MDSHEARETFREARKLMERGYFQESLPYWEKLYKAFPGERDVLFGAAHCLENAGRLGDARKLAEELDQLHRDPRAQEMLLRIPPQEAPVPPPQPEAPAPPPEYGQAGVYGGAAETVPGAAPPGDMLELNVNLFDELDAAPRAAAPRPIPKQSGPGFNWPLIAIWGVLFAHTAYSLYSIYGMIGIVMKAIAQNTAGETLSEETAAQLTAMQSRMSGINLLAAIFVYLVISYAIMRICRDIGDEAGLLAWIPIARIVPLARTAEMGCFLTGLLCIPVLSYFPFFFLGYRLCESCDKSPAWILLLLAPNGRALLLSYLALKE